MRSTPGNLSGAIRRLATAASCLALAAIVALPPISTSAGPIPFTFTIYIAGTCVYGIGPANDSLTMTLKDRDGVLVDTKMATTNGGGGIIMASCFVRGVESHDRVRATDGSVSRTFTIPLLTATINRVTNVISGRAPANSTVSLSGCHYPDYATCASFNVPKATNSSGTYSKDMTSIVDLIGRDFFNVGWVGPSGDQVYRQASAPNATVYLGSREVSGRAPALASVTVQLRTASGILKGSGSDVADYYGGAFYLELRDSDGAATYVRAGDKISGNYAGDASFKMPSMTVAGNASTEHVNGGCLKSRPVYVFTRKPNYSSYSYAYGMTDGTGAFNLDMSNAAYPTFNLAAGDVIDVHCLTSKGDEVSIEGVVP